MLAATDTLDIAMSAARSTFHTATLEPTSALGIAAPKLHAPNVVVTLPTHWLIRLSFLRRYASIAHAYRDTPIHGAVPVTARSRVVMCTRLSVHTRSRRQVSDRRMADQLRT